MAETVYVGRGQDVRGMPGLEYKRPDYTVSPEPKSVVLILEIVGIRDDPVWGIFFLGRHGGGLNGENLGSIIKQVGHF